MNHFYILICFVLSFFLFSCERRPFEKKTDNEMENRGGGYPEGDVFSMEGGPEKEENIFTQLGESPEEDGSEEGSPTEKTVKSCPKKGRSINAGGPLIRSRPEVIMTCECHDLECGIFHRITARAGVFSSEAHSLIEKSCDSHTVSSFEVKKCHHENKIHGPSR